MKHGNYRYKNNASLGFRYPPSKKRIVRMIPRLASDRLQTKTSKWQLKAALFGLALLSSVALISFTMSDTCHSRRLAPARVEDMDLMQRELDKMNREHRAAIDKKKRDERKALRARRKAAAKQERDAAAAAALRDAEAARATPITESRPQAAPTVPGSRSRAASIATCTANVSRSRAGSIANAAQDKSTHSAAPATLEDKIMAKDIMAPKDTFPFPRTNGRARARPCVSDGVNEGVSDLRFHDEYNKPTMSRSKLKSTCVTELGDAGIKEMADAVTKDMKEALAEMNGGQLTKILNAFYPESPTIFKTKTKRHLYRFSSTEHAHLETQCTKRETAIPEGAEVCVLPGNNVARNKLQKKIFVNVEYALEINQKREKRGGWIVAADYPNGEKFGINQYLKKSHESNAPKPCQLEISLKMAH